MLAAAALIGATAATLFAQSDSLPRHGPYGGIGAAWAAGRPATCTGCSNVAPKGWTGYLEAGVTLDPRLRIGVEAIRADLSLYSQPMATSFYMATATYYPTASRALWIEGSAGYGSGRTATLYADTVAETLAIITTPHSGFAMGLGIGYDVDAQASNIAFVPCLKLFDQFSSNGGRGPLLFMLGAGLAYRH